MKKIILILLLFTLTTYAKTTPDSKQAIENAKLVLEKGWSKAKDPLKSFIENDGEKWIPTFLQDAKEPHYSDKTKKLNPTKSDYIYALSYARYLESQNHISKAIPIYIESLKGLQKLHNTNKEKTGMIEIIWKIIIENIITKAINLNIYNKIQKNKLLSELKNALILDKNLWTDIIKNEREFQFKLCNEGKLSELKSLKRNYDDNLTVTLLCNKVHNQNKLGYALLGSVEENDKEWDIFITNFLKEKKRFEKSYESLSLEELMIYTWNYDLFNLEFREIRKKFLDMITFNKNLLKSLEKNKH